MRETCRIKATTGDYVYRLVYYVCSCQNSSRGTLQLSRFTVEEASLVWSMHKHASAYSLGAAQKCMTKPGQIDRQAGLMLLLHITLQHLFLMHYVSLCQKLF